MTLLAFSMWGGWTAYINHNHGLTTSLISGSAQGIQSAISTFFGTVFIEWLYKRFGHLKAGAFIVGTITSANSLLIMLLLHYIVGTPEILLTIAPVITMATLYCYSYAFSLSQPDT